jgi:hypothetical protein
LRILQSPRTISEALKNNIVTEQEKFQFVVASIIFNSITESRDLLSVLGTIYMIPWFIKIGIAIYGTWYAFQENSRRDNHQFIDRFICLIFVISIRVNALLYIFYFSLGIIGETLSIGRFTSFLPIPVLSFFLWYILYFGASFYIYHKLRSLISYIASSNLD